MTHAELCDRAVNWLRGTMRCNPVLSGIASTSEIPDAIGWSNSGSIVVECKRSRADFHRDIKKGTGWHGKNRPAPRLGCYRWFLTPAGLLRSGDMEKYPDHGLAEIHGRQIKRLLPAGPRQERDQQSEIRLLRFALVHARENLLRAGFTVDMCELTKHWASADMSTFNRVSPPVFLGGKGIPA